MQPYIPALYLNFKFISAGKASNHYKEGSEKRQKGTKMLTEIIELYFKDDSLLILAKRFGSINICSCYMYVIQCWELIGD